MGSWWTVGRIAAALGLLASVAVVATLGDPGITVDEPLDVRPGRAYLSVLRARGWRFFDRRGVELAFRDNAEHPPLGRWLLGLAATVGEPFEGGLLGGPDPFDVHAGRLAPAVCFGVLVGLVALASGRRGGRPAAWAAGVALVLMPRMFAHAHLAALDTFLSLFWTWALLRAEHALRRPRPVAAMALAGPVWGLALLTKIHAWLLPPIVAAWALTRLRTRTALAAVGAWTMTGLATWFAGWPWLWYDTADRLRAYFGTAGVGRVVLQAQYFGQVYRDRDLPWHYPWFYFAVTVPVGLHLLGVLGVARSLRDRRRDPFPLLLLGAMAVFLVLFSTRVPVYDGERLFLPVFPLWAILIGLGFGAARERLKTARLRVLLALAVAAQGYGVWALHPFGLSYYNLLVGGLPGAERLGLELTTWGDAVDRVLLDALARRGAPGESAALAPTLHHLQAAADMTAPLLRRDLRLEPQEALAKVDWLVAYRRTAYWTPAVRHWTAASPPVAVRSRQGVWLAGLWRRPSAPNPSAAP